MRALDWLNDILVWFASWFPRVDLVQANEGGVLYYRNGGVRELKPGIYWYIPAIHNVETLPTRRQTIAFSQRLTTKDGYTVQVKAVVIYRIDDVLKALVDTHDVEDTIEEAALKATVQPVCSRPFDRVLEDLTENNAIRNELAAGVRSVLRPFGVTIEDAFLSDFTETTVFSHDGEGLAVTHHDG